MKKSQNLPEKNCKSLSNINLEGARLGWKALVVVKGAGFQVRSKK